MANTAGFNNQVFTQGETAEVQRSLFNLSYSNTFTLNEGLLAPFYLQDCLPGDTMTLSNNIQAYQMPLEVPVTNNITLYTQYFFVPYRLLWKHFKPGIHGGRYGDYEPEFPTFKGFVMNEANDATIRNSINTESFMLINDRDNTAYNQWVSTASNEDTITISRGKHTPYDYMGFPLPYEKNTKKSGGVEKKTYAPSKKKPFTDTNNKLTSTTEISAFPLMAYQRIYRDYYLNQHINKDWFGFDDIDDWTLKDGTQNYIEFENQKGNTKRIYLNEPRFVDWGKDYFTTAVTSPFLGTQPGINSNIDASEAVPDVTERDEGSNFMTATTIGPNPPTIRMKGTADLESQKRGTRNIRIAFEKQKLATPITMENIRLLSALTMQMEQMAKIDGNYEEYLRVTYGIKPNNEECEKPVYIGGTTQPIIVQSVIQTSETTSNSSLGQMAGKGVTNSDGYVGKFTAKEPGLIMGIMHIMPETIYAQGIDREWTRETQYDWPIPAYEGLGMEGILTRELYAYNTEITDATMQTRSITGGDQEELFGYQNRNDSYRHRRNIVTTNLRYTEDQYWKAWTQYREFESKPTLTNELLRAGYVTIKNFRIYWHTTVPEFMYTAPSEPHFVVKAWNGCRAVRPLPKQASNNYL